MRKNLLNLLFASILILGLAPDSLAQVGGPNGSGQWSGVIQMPIVPVGAANLPNGKVLTWSARDRFSFGGNAGRTYTAIFDPATNTSQELLVSNTQHDMFCPGTSTMPDGRIMVTGGSSSNKTSFYDPFTDQWTSGPNMGISRGYHSQVTLSDGNVFIIGGSWSGGTGNKHGEIYENGAWRRINGVPVNVILDGATDPAGMSKNDNFPWLWPAPNGQLFHAGPSTSMHWIDTRGNGSYSNAGPRSDDEFAYAGTTVMYDKGLILKTGGAASYGDGRPASGTTYIIDINTNQAQVEKVQDLAYPRNKHDVVVLPTGEVLAIGGLGIAREFSDTQSRLIPELFNPITKTWRSLAPMQIPRNYHSIALLLPDGRVMAGGGGLCGGCTVNHPDVEIYSPPYLFNANGTPATRPAITNSPSLLTNEKKEIVNANGAVSYFSLVRYNVATHSTNNDQRRIAIPTTSLGNNSYELDLPNANVLPPGYYMLFAVNANGTPSIAEVVQIAPETVNPGGSGLTANYFNNTDFTAPVLNRVDQNINFNWGTGSPDPSIGADTYSVRWEGSVVAPTTGTYTFFTESDDGVRLWVNGQLLIDKWVAQSTKEWSGTIALQAEQQVDIKMEYFEQGGAAVARLKWSGPNVSKQIIPTDYLFPLGTIYTPKKPVATFTATPPTGVGPLTVAFDANASIDPDGTIASYAWNFGDGTTATGITTSHVYNQTGSYISRLIVTDQGGNTDTAFQTIDVGDPPLNPGGTGLTGNYFNNIDLTAPVFNRVDPVINFNWGTGSPAPSMGPETFSVKWEGSIVAPYTGPYTFYTRSDDGVRLRVNGQLIINKWIDQGPTEWTGSIALTKGQQVEVIMDYYENGGGAVASLSWSGPFTAKQIIPKDYLFPKGVVYNSQDPIADFTATPGSGTAPVAVSFDASASTDDGPIVSYAWDFGDGATGTGVNAIHTYSNPGDYEVKLTVTDQVGSTGEKTIIVSSYASIPDSDSDNLADNLDWDDDNDGILDTEEGCALTSLAAAADLAAGMYKFNFGNGDFNAYVDGNGWILWLQYHHKAGTNPALNIIANGGNLPMYDPSGLGKDNSADLVRWGHGGQAFASAIPDASLKLRYQASTSAHARVIDFETTNLGEFKTNGSNSSGIQNDHTDFAGQTSNLPGAARSFYSNQGDLALTNFPFWLGGTYHWGIRGNGNRWEVDDYAGNGANNTIHRVWVKATGSNVSAPLCDKDGDEIINRLDKDSDEDGCPDALEGSATIAMNQVSDGSLIGAVDVNGVPNLVNGGQGIGLSQNAASQDTDCVEPNVAPSAVISAAPTTGEAPLPVSFDGSASTDDKGVTAYSWDFGDGTTATGASTTHTYALAGSYTATLTVSDQEGLTDNASVTIIVNEPVVDPPLDGDCFIVSGTQEVWIEAENFSAQQAGTSNASGSSWVVYDDPSAAAGKAVRAEPNADVFTGLDINGPRLDYNVYFSQAGTYTLFVRGQGPTGSDDSFHAGLNGSALTTTAGWGMIVSTAWTWASYANDGILVELDIPAIGTYTINLWMREDGVAVDKLYILPTGAGGPAGAGQPESNTADCDNVSPVNSAPTASFTATPTSGSAPLAVSFDGSASTDDNAVTSYSWNFGDGTSATGPTASHTYTNPGQYVASLTVSDVEGLTNSTTENILVQSANNGNCFAEAGGQVVIEAEDFSRVAPGTGNAAGTSWSVVSEADASGSSAVEAGPNTGLWTGLNLNGPRLDYDIDFSETGIYNVYVRSQGANGNDDSYHIGLNGSGLSNISDYGMGGEGPWAWQSIANDDEAMQINIQSVGKQTFNIWVREDGVQIDKIVIKKVSGAPAGQGPGASTQSPCGGDANQAPVASFTAAPSTGAAPLALTADASGSSDPDGSIASYDWDFGDGTQGSGQNMAHTYTSVGTYTLRLTVTDNAGLTNSSTRTIRVTPPANGPLCYEEVGGVVVMEAENFSATTPGTGNASANSWQKVTDANASNSEGLKAMPNNGTYTGLAINGPRVDYNINFQTAGTYRIYIRTQGANGQDDSYHVGLNGTPVSTQNGYGMGWTGSWGWAYFANEDDFVEVVVLSTGQHTFNVWMREDGVEIDKIVLKIQAGIPSGLGPDANEQSACPDNNFGPAQSFSVAEEGGNGVINWGNFFEEFKDNYTLERSVDGNTFEVLENEEIIVDENYHTHTDPNIRQYSTELIKYRLKIKDARGITREVREGILNFRGAFSSFDFRIYPNPARDKMNLEFDNSSGKDLNLTILNSLGQTLLREGIEGSRTDGILKLDVSEYAKGIYFIKLTDNEKSQVLRILVE